MFIIKKNIFCAGCLYIAQCEGCEMEYKGMKNINGLTEEDCIKGERAWAYSRTTHKPAEVDTFWHMARSDLGRDTQTPILPEYWKNDTLESRAEAADVRQAYSADEITKEEKKSVWGGLAYALRAFI
jgi:hypothetical protein